MENARRELLSVLLGRLYEMGLIAKSTYSGAEDLLHSDMDLPEFFDRSACLPRGEDMDERTENPQ